MNGTKTCKICNLEKDKQDHFSVNRANPDGFEYFCKECKSIKAKAAKRRQKKIYVSAIDGFDAASESYYVVEQCEVCGDSFYPIRPSHKRCPRCSDLVRNTQSHLSASRHGNSEYKISKCNALQAVEVVKLIIVSDNCCYCQRLYTKDNPKSIDHIIPIVRGGDHETDNINICCLQCNLSKRDLMLEEWLDLCRRVAHNRDHQ